MNGFDMTLQLLAGAISLRTEEEERLNLQVELS